MGSGIVWLNGHCIYIFQISYGLRTRLGIRLLRKWPAETRVLILCSFFV